MWILQTLPSIVLGLFTRWFHRWALLIGWAVGMVYGTVIAYGFCTACTTRPFGNSLAVVPWLERAGYIGLTALVVNVVVTVVLTAVFRGLKVDNGTDITQSSDYFADIGRPAGRGRRQREEAADPLSVAQLPVGASSSIGGAPLASEDR